MSKKTRLGKLFTTGVVSAMLLTFALGTSVYAATADTDTTVPSDTTVTATPSISTKTDAKITGKITLNEDVDVTGTLYIYRVPAVNDDAAGTNVITDKDTTNTEVKDDTDTTVATDKVKVGTIAYAHKAGENLVSSYTIDFSSFETADMLTYNFTYEITLELDKATCEVDGKTVECTATVEEPRCIHVIIEKYTVNGEVIYQKAIYSVSKDEKVSKKQESADFDIDVTIPDPEPVIPVDPDPVDPDPVDPEPEPIKPDPIKPDPVKPDVPDTSEEEKTSTDTTVTPKPGKDSTDTTTTTSPSPVVTGDFTKYSSFIALGIGALVVIVSLIFLGKKKNNNYDDYDEEDDEDDDENHIYYDDSDSEDSDSDDSEDEE